MGLDYTTGFWTQVYPIFQTKTIYTTTVANTRGAANTQNTHELNREILENAIRMLKEQNYYYGPDFYSGYNFYARPRQDYLKLIQRNLPKKSNHQCQTQKKENQRTNIFQDVLRYVAGKG